MLTSVTEAPPPASDDFPRLPLDALLRLDPAPAEGLQIPEEFSLDVMVTGTISRCRLLYLLTPFSTLLPSQTAGMMFGLQNVVHMLIQFGSF